MWNISGYITKTGKESARTRRGVFHRDRRHDIRPADPARQTVRNQSDLEREDLKMSAEIARAFCVRMMTDDDFRASLANVATTAEIDRIMAAEQYSFTKDDLNKVVGEVVGHKLEQGELEKLVCGFYEEQMAAGNPDACKVVVEWIAALK